MVVCGDGHRPMKLWGERPRRRDFDEKVRVEREIRVSRARPHAVDVGQALARRKAPGLAARIGAAVFHRIRQAIEIDVVKAHLEDEHAAGQTVET